MNYYVVRINCGDQGNGKPLYLSVDRLDDRITAVSTRSAATKFETKGVAAVISSYFWDHCWKEYKYQKHGFWSREVVYIKSRNRGASFDL